MLREFRAFVARGNVLDLAVAVIIGAAFGKDPRYIYVAAKRGRFVSASFHQRSATS